MIDIVMTAYNAAWSLPDTLASIAAQTVRDIRLIVVDDGSTDETPLILARAAAADPRILVLTEPNGGDVFLHIASRLVKLTGRFGLRFLLLA